MECKACHVDARITNVRETQDKAEITYTCCNKQCEKYGQDVAVEEITKQQ